MPVIPTYGDSKVQTSGASLPGVSVNPDTGGEQLGHAVGGAIANVGHELGQVYEKASQEADAQAVTNAETALQATANKALHDPQSGLMYKQGNAAFAASGEVYAGLSKAREDIAEKLLQNDRQRRLFNMRSGGMLEDFHRQIETHAGTQLKVAQQADVNARVETGLNAVASNYADSQTAAKQLVALEGPLRAFQLSKEDGDAKVAALHQKVAEVRLNMALEAQDYDFASKFYPQAKEALGAKAGQYEGRVRVLGEQVKADAMAQQLVRENMEETGRPIEGAILAKVAEQPPGPFREKLEQQVQVRMQHAMQAYQQVETDRLGRIFTTIERSGGYLNQASDDFQQLAPMDKAKALERRNAILRTDKAERSNADKEELARFSALPREEQAAVSINTEFPSASQTARYQMQHLQNGVKSALSKGAMEPLNEFDAQVKGVSTQLGLPKSDGDKLKAQMDAWYLQRQRDNNGKGPTRVEVEQELAQRLQRGNGWFGGNLGASYRFQVGDGEFEPGTAEQPYQKVQQAAGGATPAKAAPQASAPQASSGKTVVGYRYTKSRTRRKPVYSDGTEGAAEDVHGR